jgi:hypothetical protein
MNANVLPFIALFLLGFTATVTANEAPLAQEAPTIDGIPNDQAWKSGNWVDLKYSILDTSPTAEDFSGRYMVVWTPAYLYVLAEIVDDVLLDSTADPFVSYWNDDTLEFFIDEDASGGNHLQNDNAYAYHISLDNQVIDIGPDGKPMTYPSHVTAEWKRSTTSPNRVFWEARISLFAEGSTSPRRLRQGESIGFMVAYCDADSVNGRDHFFGDVEIEPVDGDRNLGYIDASVFGKLILTKQKNQN